MRTHVLKWSGAVALALTLALTDLTGMVYEGLSSVNEAQARVGRPATPGSVAGVARRTTRRVIRRSTIYIPVLPAGCVRTSVNGVAIWRCGGVYYQPYGGRYVVVYIN
jgi:hypothetical protein